MYKLDFDFKSLSPYVIDAFSSVYGEEYRSIISDRINKSIIIPYHDIDGLNGYVKYLLDCKSREFSIRFLEEIGIDVSAYKRDNYGEPLDSAVQNILWPLILNYGFAKVAELHSPLLAFVSDNKVSPVILFRYKINLFNYLIGDKQNIINEDNYKAFTKTDKYLELLKKVNKYALVYKKLLSEYREWEKQIVPLREYIYEENVRKDRILKKARSEFFKKIFDYLPVEVRNAASNKIIVKPIDIILGKSDILLETSIEFFSSKYFEKLKSSDVSSHEKHKIIYQQISFLKSLGVIFPRYVSYYVDGDINNYLSFLNKDGIREYVPSFETVDYISTVRKKMSEDAIREYYMTRKDFVDAMKLLDGVIVLPDYNNNRNKSDYVYRQMRDRTVCIMGYGGYDRNADFCSIMFYTVKLNGEGYLFQTFMHECGHIIDQNLNKGSGFDLLDIIVEANPYNRDNRKYEIFNEAINDIFTIEAVEFLKSQGIYLIEPKEFILPSISERNTSLFIRGLLDPLVELFKPQVIKAKINSDPQELTKYIGEDNFEELVDIVNKIDFLFENGYLIKEGNSSLDDMNIEYQMQIERIIQVYASIFDYANIHGDLATKKLNKIYKKWEKIRDNL